MVQLTSLAGTAQTAEWMSSTWPLLRASSVNEEGELTAAQVFELSYFLSQSRTLWLFAMDDLLLAFGVGAAACLIYTSSQVNRALGHLGVAIVLLCCIDFAFEVSRFVDWRVSSNAVVITSLFLDAVRFRASEQRALGRLPCNAGPACDLIHSLSPTLSTYVTYMYASYTCHIGPLACMAHWHWPHAPAHHQQRRGLHGDRRTRGGRGDDARGDGGGWQRYQGVRCSVRGGSRSRVRSDIALLAYANRARR